MQDKVSAFTRELIDEIARDHYRLRAWRRLLSRSWLRSLEDMDKSPARTRSFWLWVVAVAAMGIGIILLTLWFRAPEQALTASLLWLPWYAGSVFFVVTHLGMVDDSHGMPHQRLLLANGLSFMRLALAPLIIWPCLQIPAHPVTRSIFALCLNTLLVSDLLDGWLARRNDQCTRLGRMLDVIADMAILTFLAIGLYLAEIIPGPLLLLLIVRYPTLLIVLLVLSFARGPITMRPSIIGKVTTFATSVVLLGLTFQTFLAAAWPTAESIEWSIWFLYMLISANIVYLLYRGVTWTDE